MSGLAKTRLKRILLLLFLAGTVGFGLKFLPRGEAAFWEKLPVKKESLVNLGNQVFTKTFSLGGKKLSEKESQEAIEKKTGEVAGVAEEILAEPKGVIQGKIDEAEEVLKNLPEQEAKKIRAQIKKQICEEMLKDF